jgi:hypothetical protein
MYRSQTSIFCQGKENWSSFSVTALRQNTKSTEHFKIVSPSIALPATRPSIRSPAAGSQKGRWETISGVSKDRWQIISGVCSGRCSKKA